MRKHYGSPLTSERLKIVQRLLKRKQGATGADIQAATGSICAHSDVHSLRQYWRKVQYSDIYIPPAEYAGCSKSGSKIYRYRMVRY